MNYHMHQFCKENSIRHQTSCARTPQQNGFVERRNRQIMEIVRASLFDMKVPREYWGVAVKSSAYLMNRTPSHVLEFKTPLQRMHELVDIPLNNGLEPRSFSCTTYVHQSTGKLEPRASRCIFLGYAELKKGYRCYDPILKKLYVTRDVSFHEMIPYIGNVCPIQGESNKESNPLCNNEINDVPDFEVHQTILKLIRYLLIMNSRKLMRWRRHLMMIIKILQSPLT